MNMAGKFDYYSDCSRYKCDISIREQVEELVRKVKNDVGDVTILINNAGIQIIRPLGQYTPTQIEKTVAVNLLGLFLLK